MHAKLLDMKDIEISIKGLRAVKNADIALNGITILSGVNSSGKSTISRLLYYAIKYANDYESVVKLQFSKAFNSILNVVEVLDRELRNYLPDQHIAYYFEYFSASNEKERRKVLVNALNTYKDLLDKLSKESTNIQFVSRISHIIQNDVLEKKTDKSISELMSDLIANAQQLFDTEEQMITERAYAPYQAFVENKMRELMPNVVISEYGMPFFGERKVKYLPVLNTVRRIAYIDTPMTVGVLATQPSVEYWKDLYELLREPLIPANTNSEFISKISEKIRGEATYDIDSLNSPLLYKRNDGKVFNLLESATGIKSFSILQILLNNGFIDKNTLLIIDEPEAHLHPQWIVEYARIIVLIHKHIGTKFFIASHSTDFVSAIKYIATKEKCLSSLSYYLSEEEAEKPFSYNYRSLGQDIEPIFESFNKSFELIDKYGTDND